MSTATVVPVRTAIASSVSPVRTTTVCGPTGCTAPGGTASGGVVLAQPGADEQHRDRDGEQEQHGRRDPRELRAVDRHQPAAAQTEDERRAASAPAAARQSSAGASRYA